MTSERPDIADPIVSFGLLALATAMDAKAGNLVGRTALNRAEHLIAEASRLLPADERVAAAVGAFAGTVMYSPPQAGADLHAFIIGWQSRNGDHAHSPDWHQRKDCGHD